MSELYERFVLQKKMPNDEVLEEIKNVIDLSLNPRTLTQYKSCWRDWKTKCFANNVSLYDASPDDIMAYFLQLSKRVGISRIYIHLSAISFYYRRKGFISPCDHTKVKMFMKGLKRVKSDVNVKRAKPLNTKILKKLVSCLDNEKSLVTWRTIWRLCVGFSCFLRWDDIQRLKVSHLTEKKNRNGPYLQLQLIGGKTNQLNDPDYRVITHTGTLLCPYTLTKRYLARLGAGYDGYLQPSCMAHDKSVPNPERKIPYSLALSNMRALLTKFGYPGHLFSEHSIRRGVATHSAKVGLSDNEIRLAGGWKNVKTAQLYIDRKAAQIQSLSSRILQ